MNGIFVTGTDTGVGKTFISCAIAKGLRKKGIDTGVMKPIETGCKKRNNSLVPADGISLKKSAGVDDPLDLIVPYRFSAPLAPFIAAELENKRINILKIKNSYIKITKRHDFIIIEGAGGVLVPITKSYTYLNLIKDICIPVVIVAANKLGVINHLMLTVHSLKQNRITPYCVILNNIEHKKNIAQRTNLYALKNLLKNIPILDVPFNPGEKLQEKIVELLNGCNLI